MMPKVGDYKVGNVNIRRETERERGRERGGENSKREEKGEMEKSGETR
jgi:hypothetical protein